MPSPLCAKPLHASPGLARRSLRSLLGASLVVALTGPVGGLQADDSGARLKPGVLPGDIVVLREVDSAPIGRGERYAGDITSRVNARHNALEVQQRLTGVQAISLSDEQAAGISSGVRGSIGHLHRALGTDTARSSGAALGSAGVVGRASTSFGGGSAGGSVRSVTSGISGTLDAALAPLTSGGR